MGSEGDNRILILEKAPGWSPVFLDCHSTNDLLLLKDPAINMNLK